jgi:hypothetical protein
MKFETVGGYYTCTGIIKYGGQGNHQKMVNLYLYRAR